MHVDGLNLEDQGLIQLFCGIGKGKSAFIVFCLAFFHNYCQLEPLEEYKGIHPPQGFFSCLRKVIFHKLSWRTTRAYTLQGHLGLFCKPQEVKGLTPLGLCGSNIPIQVLLLKVKYIFQGYAKRSTRAYTLLAFPKLTKLHLASIRAYTPKVLSQTIFFIDPINPIVRH